MTPIEQVREALDKIIQMDPLDYVNASMKWPEPPPMDDRWTKAVCGAAERATTQSRVIASSALSLLKTMEGEPVMWMSSTGMTLSHSEYKMWRDTTDERGPSYMRTFTIPLYRHPSPHIKTITVDEVETLIRLLERSRVGTKFAREYEKKCQPDQEARTGIDFDKDVDAMLFLLRDRLTAKFK